MTRVNFSPFNNDKTLDIEEGNQAEYEDTDDNNNYAQEAGWDEGGMSDCGYSDSVHDALMSIGKLMHSYFGEPSDELHDQMRVVGNTFQEASYTVRDFQRSPSDELQEHMRGVGSAFQQASDTVKKESGFLFLENEDEQC